MKAKFTLEEDTTPQMSIQQLFTGVAPQDSKTKKVLLKTNFPIDEIITDILSGFEGSDIVQPISRYRVLIILGDLFDTEEFINELSQELNSFLEYVDVETKSRFDWWSDLISTLRDSEEYEKLANLNKKRLNDQ